MDGIRATFFGLCILSVFLLVGKLMRVRIRLFQRLFLPSAILGGFVALGLGPHGLDLLPRWVIGAWSELPAILINVVFASLFLGVSLPRPAVIWEQGGSQLCYGCVVGMGQYLVALLVTALVLGPLFGVPVFFGCVLEIGFSGGHGTAAGMADVFAQLGWAAGGPLGQMSATIGLLVAVIGGIVLINIAVRRGQCAFLNEREGIPAYKRVGLIPEPKRYSIATATVASEVIEPLTFHFAIISIAILVGWGMLQGVQRIHPILSGFPLFPLAMVGGLVVQGASARLGASAYFDRDTFDRILGFALDVLILAAIASLRLDLFAANLWPFLILMVVGVAWVVVATLVLAPRMFPAFWFERSITEFGMQTGVTAIGLLLLRLVDPMYRSGTATAFGFKQMVYEPFLGGGLVTALAPFAILSLGLWGAIGVCAATIAFFLVVARLNGWLRLRPAVAAAEAPEVEPGETGAGGA